jgi:hypothetical protein
MKYGKILFILTFLMSFAALAKDAANAPTEANTNVKQYVICRNQKIVRTIRVECLPSGACDTIYNKDGADLTQASKINAVASLRILGNIKNNLEKAAWKCNDVTANAKIDN